MLQESGVAGILRDIFVVSVCADEADDSDFSRRDGNPTESGLSKEVMQRLLDIVPSLRFVCSDLVDVSPEDPDDWARNRDNALLNYAVLQVIVPELRGTRASAPASRESIPTPRQNKHKHRSHHTHRLSASLGILDLSDEFVMFIPGSRSRLARYDWIRIANLLESLSYVSAIGAKVIYQESGRIRTVGTDFTIVDVDEGDMAHHVVVPGHEDDPWSHIIEFYDVFAGFRKTYSRRYDDSLVSVAKEGIVIRIEDFVAVGGFMRNLDIVDLCLRLRFEEHKTVMYLPENWIFVPGDQSTNDDPVKYVSSRETRSVLFLDEWTPKLIELLSARTSLVSDEYVTPPPLHPASRHGSPNVPRRLNYDLQVAYDYGGGGCSGWFIEATNFVIHLQKFLSHLRVILRKSDYCEGLASYVTSSLDRLIDRKFANITVWISHKPPHRYPDFEKTGSFSGVQNVPGFPQYIIGRSMFETTRIPETWIEKMNWVDEVWVPSRFVENYFIQSGVPAEKVVYIPETLDQHFYDPDTVLPLAEGVLPGKRGRFNFLSVFKWGKRKGAKFLIEAFVSEFSRHEDNTTLYILTYGKFQLDKGGRIRDKAGIESEIAAWIEELPDIEERRRSADIPEIVVLCPEKPFPTYMMPSLYKSMNAFVLPTRGEGFGLPIMEAMLMRLPAITTGFSGHLDFADRSFLVDVEELEVATVEDLVHVTVDPQNTFWAKPSLPHLRDLMRYVMEHPREARMKARNGRDYVIRHFSPEVVTKMIVDRLKYIGGNLDALKKRSRNLQEIS